MRGCEMDKYAAESKRGAVQQCGDQILLCVAANKTYLYQETKALLNPKRLAEFVKEKVCSCLTQIHLWLV